MKTSKRLKILCDDSYRLGKLGCALAALFLQLLADSLVRV
jgi:hypothetical protein